MQRYTSLHSIHRKRHPMIEIGVMGARWDSAGRGIGNAACA